MLNFPFAKGLSTPLAATAQLDEAAHFNSTQLRMMDRFSLFALFAANQAVEESQRALAGVDRSRAGVFVGTGMGGTTSMDDGYKTLYGCESDRIKPFTILMGMHNAAAAWIGIEHRLQGPNMTYSTACSSAAVAIGEAWLRVASGQLEVAIAGGAEAPLSRGSLMAWCALHTVAQMDAQQPSSSCRPFSMNRSGMVLGEGAAMLLIEPWDRARSRGAQIVGEILGYGLCNDASHITRPSMEGQSAAMRAALQSAEIGAHEVQAINAHGTGTQANDPTETRAIKAVFGDHAQRLAVSSTKSMHGHALGAGGAIELVAVIGALRDGVLPPTINYLGPDPECDLDVVPNESRDRPVSAALSNSFAFGGLNAVLALRRWG